MQLIYSLIFIDILHYRSYSQNLLTHKQVPKVYISPQNSNSKIAKICTLHRIVYSNFFTNSRHEQCSPRQAGENVWSQVENTIRFKLLKQVEKNRTLTTTCNSNKNQKKLKIIKDSIQSPGHFWSTNSCTNLLWNSFINVTSRTLSMTGWYSSSCTQIRIDMFAVLTVT